MLIVIAIIKDKVLVGLATSNKVANSSPQYKIKNFAL